MEPAQLLMRNHAQIRPDTFRSIFKPDFGRQAQREKEEEDKEVSKVRMKLLPSPGTRPCPANPVAASRSRRYTSASPS